MPKLGVGVKENNAHDLGSLELHTTQNNGQDLGSPGLHDDHDLGSPELESREVGSWNSKAQSKKPREDASGKATSQSQSSET